MKNAFINTWDKLIQDSTLLTFKKDQALFYKGHLPYGIFIIASGKVDLIFEHDGDKKEIIGAPRNSPIGMDLLFDNQPYPFTAMATGPVKAFFISKSSLYKAFQINDGVPKKEEHI